MNYDGVETRRPRGPVFARAGRCLSLSEAVTSTMDISFTDGSAKAGGGAPAGTVVLADEQGSGPRAGNGPPVAEPQGSRHLAWDTWVRPGQSHRDTSVLFRCGVGLALAERALGARGVRPAQSGPMTFLLEDRKPPPAISLCEAGAWAADRLTWVTAGVSVST